MKKTIFLITFCISGFIFSQTIDEDTLNYLESLPENIKEDILKNANNKFEDKDSLSGEDSGLQEILIDDIEQQTQKSDIFGIDYIRTVPKSITSTSDLPVPNNYLIGLGDEIKIILSGNKNQVFTLKVGLNGDLIIPELGIVQAFGQTFQQLEENVKKLVDISYVGVDAFITISNLSAKKINIIGAVEFPGTYLVNPFTTISNALVYSGGVKDYASLRNIVLISGGKESSFDLYDLLIDGDRTYDNSLNQGDTIIVKSTTNFVRIDGNVLRPMIYEYKSSDSFSDLIKFSMGFGKDANKKELFFSSIKNGQKITAPFSLDQKIEQTDLRDIYINNSFFIPNEDIKIRGNGVKETIISKEIFNTAEGVINSLEFSEDVYPFYSTISQNNSESGLEVKSFSLFDIESFKNIKITKNASFKFYRRDEILALDKNNFSLEIGEQALSEDEIELINSLNKSEVNLIKRHIISYYNGDEVLQIPLTGKFTPESVHSYFVKKPYDSYANTTSLTQSGPIQNSYNQSLESEEVFAIVIPSKTINTKKVSIEGQVNSPGEYDLPMNATLDDLYSLSGGLLSTTNGVVLSRQSLIEKEKENLQLAKNLLLNTFTQNANNGGEDAMALFNVINSVDQEKFIGRVSGNLSFDSPLAKKIILQEGDRIIVPPESSTVSVFGEVLNPLSTEFVENLTVEDYIRLAGGFTNYASKKNIYIIKVDGTSIPYNPKLFAKKIYLEPGDAIIVPRDLTKVEGLPFIALVSQVLSNIAFAAASLNAVSK